MDLKVRLQGNRASYGFANVSSGVMGGLWIYECIFNSLAAIGWFLVVGSDYSLCFYAHAFVNHSNDRSTQDGSV